MSKHCVSQTIQFQISPLWNKLCIEHPVIHSLYWNFELPDSTDMKVCVMPRYLQFLGIGFSKYSGFPPESDGVCFELFVRSFSVKLEHASLNLQPESEPRVPTRVLEALSILTDRFYFSQSHGERSLSKAICRFH